jgi:glycine betaine/proline transport system substrate-binding protein
MKVTKYVWIFGLMALMVMGLAACGADPTATPTAPPQADPTPTAMMEEKPADAMAGEECPDNSKPEIVFTDLDWTSGLIQAAIAEAIVHHGYCYPTDSILLSTIPGMQALVNGDTHVSMEIWIPNQLEAWETALAAGTVENAGKSLEDNWQATFVVPQYTKDNNPGLVSVEDLKKEEYWSLFVTPDSEGKARLLNCIPGWECEKVNLEKIESYELGDYVEPINPGSGAALEAEIRASIEKEEDVLFYYWGPTTLMHDVQTKYGGYYILEEEEFTDECWESGKKCAYGLAQVYIGINSELKTLAPDLIPFLEAWDFNAGNQLAAEGYKSETDAEIDDVAIWFLQNTEEWKEWVAEGVADKVLAGLAG